MKKALFTLAGVCLGIIASAQQFGISAQGVVWMQRPQEIEIDLGNTSRIMKTGVSPAVGFRVEGNYILPGFNIPVSGYNGVGLTYISPSTDSAFYYAESASGFGPQIGILGTRKTSILSIGLRFGYEIPQEFNDFLLLHYGFGFSFTRFTTQNVLPEQSSTFQYTASDFKSETFDKVKDGGMGIEIMVGAVYEFESFSLFGQYSLMIPMVAFDSDAIGLRHGPTVGLFYPLYRLM